MFCSVLGIAIFTLYCGPVRRGSPVAAGSVSCFSNVRDARGVKSLLMILVANGIIKLPLSNLGTN